MRFSKIVTAFKLLLQTANLSLQLLSVGIGFQQFLHKTVKCSCFLHRIFSCLRHKIPKSFENHKFVFFAKHSLKVLLRVFTSQFRILLYLILIIRTTAGGGGFLLGTF
ncbi:hypothetical protein MtrunA17_Chr2g0280441 [Medicago truncatula]|uniref:Transmembrane protein n=1 Tax=Medicago truncatula TaxID=3880 RepID=A0A396J328_MEDTR|nr:hypothetical protein MtrunA17_Chr2g0280441 [Medicago truncatula]